MREKTNSMSSISGVTLVALIAQVDNPRLAQAIQEFEETADILFGPPAKQHLSLWEKCIEFVYKVVSKVI